METASVRDIIDYHERTKHHYHRYARSAGAMDWANQPNPFRTYAGTPVVRLPRLKRDPDGRHWSLYHPVSGPPAAVTAENISGFLQLSMGLSAWKAYGRSRWALRMNPSSGNLHPTETHLLLPATGQCKAGVYHYRPFDHALELRAGLTGVLKEALGLNAKATGFYVALSSIFWRESWKYGERAFRYCHLDAGHALAALCFAARLFAWRVTLLDGLSDHQMETILGFDRTQWHPQEAEHTDFLCRIHGDGEGNAYATVSEKTISHFSELSFQGDPEPLSRERVPWPVIDDAARYSRKPQTPIQTVRPGERPFRSTAESTLTAAAIIRKRRSATAYDPGGAVGLDRFLGMLDRTLPRPGNAPFDVGLSDPMVHLLLFVHNVKDLTPGLYCLVRNEEDFEEIRKLAKKTFSWETVAEGLPLYLLDAGDYRIGAIQVSCHQEIAGFSAFSLGMIAKFRETVASAPHRYRHLFWECGMIGQVLYLEAEAWGARGTGIGCFFDDPVHDILGFKDNTYQSLYHFTIGKPVEDPKITTHPPYFHLEGG